MAKRIFFIFILVFAALIVALPQKISLGGTTFERKDIGRKLDLVLGLDLVGGSHLVFEADLESIPSDKQETAIESLKNVIERRVNLFGVSEPNIQVSRYEGKSRVIVELPGVYDTKQAVSLVGQTANLVFAEIADEGKKIIPTSLNGSHLKSADVNFDSVSGQPVVSLAFTEEGAKLFADLTEKFIGKPLAITLDGLIVSAPVVQERITGGVAQISGQFSLEDAKRLAIQLNAGSLPVPVHLVEERSVGATLGAESIQKSISAGIVGIAIVLIFMILMYGKLGLIADIGLIIFAILSIAVYKIIPIVLTLPGIAGFLLSVGMAVDSNILIFERFREEKKIRVNVIDALESSFGRAWDSIRDANIATLITAFILANPLDWSFLHTSGPVRGFAMTLALGIGISLFTGIYVSRNLLRVFVRSSSNNKKK